MLYIYLGALGGFIIASIMWFLAIRLLLHPLFLKKEKERKERITSLEGEIEKKGVKIKMLNSFLELKNSAISELEEKLDREKKGDEFFQDWKRAQEKVEKLTGDMNNYKGNVAMLLSLVADKLKGNPRAWLYKKVFKHIENGNFDLAEKALKEGK